jgi:hypothetical protein
MVYQKWITLKNLPQQYIILRTTSIIMGLRRESKIERLGC